MRVIRVLVALFATVTFFVLLAQSDADYAGWMKAAVASKGKVAKGIAAKDGPGTAADAKAMEASFKQIEDYWSKKGAADAVGFAKQAETVSADVAKAAAAGDFDGANAKLGTIGGACGGCHMAHRGQKGADGSYQIK
jgi:cytochrome c556